MFSIIFDASLFNRGNIIYFHEKKKMTRKKKTNKKIPSRNNLIVHQHMNGLRYGIYTQWNTTQPQKEQNNLICSKMNGTKDSHTR